MKRPTTNSFRGPLLLLGAAPIRERGEQCAFYDTRMMMSVDSSSGLAAHLHFGRSEPHATLHTDMKRETTDDE